MSDLLLPPTYSPAFLLATPPFHFFALPVHILNMLKAGVLWLALLLAVQCASAGDAQAFCASLQAPMLRCGRGISASRFRAMHLQAHADREAATEEGGRSSTPADHTASVVRAPGYSVILPGWHRSGDKYPDGTRGARRPAMRELFLRLSDDSRERARYELKQSALADELKFLGMFFVGLRLHTFSCAAFLVVLLSGMVMSSGSISGIPDCPVALSKDASISMSSR
jgi:hypothetical protein